MNLQSQALLAAPPYNDDYDRTKNFHRVLFRPGTAVQARELTQLQTILQDQVSRMGEHLFKDGSIVKGCSLSFIDDISLVRVANFFEDSNQNQLTVDDASLVGSVLVGETSGVQATLLLGRTGFEGGERPNRLFVRYTMPGKNGESTFAAGERINFHGDDDQYVEQFVLTVGSTADFAVGDFVLFGATPGLGLRGRIVAKTATDLTLAQTSRRPIAGEGIFLSSDPSKATTISDVKLNVAPRNTWIRAAAANHTGVSYGVSVSEGIIFHKGHFVRVAPHFTIVDEESRAPASKVLGFVTEEVIVTEDIDDSLYDNAAGFTNFNAPGAHRLKLVSTLASRERSDINSEEQFFPIAEFSDAGVVFERTDPEYARLGDELARRTYEESGDYTIDPHGVSAAAYSRDSNSIEYTIGAGLSYVRGRRVDVKNPLKVIGRRGTDTASYTDQLVSMTYGNFVITNEVRGFLATDTSPQVALYNTAQQAITNNRPHTTSPVGAVIGFANVRAVVYNEEPGQPGYSPKGSASARYRLYLFNVRMNAGQDFGNVRSVVLNAGGRFASADTVLESDRAVLRESSLNQMLFPIGAQAIRSLRDSANNLDTSFYYTAANTGVASLQSDGTVTFQIPNGGGQIGFSDTTAASKALIDLTIAASANVYTTNLPGTVNAVSTSNTIVGANLSNLFSPGEYIRVGSVDARVVSVANATHMVVSPAIANTTGATYQRMHVAGSVVSLDSPLRTISLSGANQVTINLGSAFVTGVPASASVQVYARKTDALPIAKEIKIGTVVRINTANNESGSTGPWCLGVPDVLRITGVFLGDGVASFDTSVNLLNRTRLDRGQQESHYDFATLSPLPGFEALFANTFVLVQFDHFVANNQQGQGFFSVESYPVDDDNTANRELTIRTSEIPVFRGTRTYDLRDCIDFRPYKAASAAITAVIPASTVNPQWVEGFDPATTTFNPFPNENFECNFTHYLGRRDVMVLTPQGQVALREGQSAIRPRAPEFPSDAMPIATIEVPPYPSVPESERTAETAGKELKITTLTQKRYTMRDISVIEKRVDRLEYYATLSALELSASTLLIPDSAGLDRFKNGIFADPLNSHVFGRVEDPQYAIAVDSEKGYARPRAFSEYFNLEMSPTQSTAVRRTGSVVTLNYTDEVLIDQPFATTLRQPSSSTFRWIGSVECSPRRWQEIETLSAPEIRSSDFKDLVFQEMAQPPLGSQFGWWRDNVRVDTETEDFIPRVSNATVTNGNNTRSTSQSSFIRGREITVRTFNLKPFTRMFVFIDEQDVTSLAAPAEGDRRTGSWGTELRTNSRGELTFRLQIPSGRFRTGRRLVTVTDSRVKDGETTFASGYLVVDLVYNYYIPEPEPAPPPRQPDPPLPIPGPSTPGSGPRPTPNQYVLDVDISAEYAGADRWDVTLSQSGRWTNPPGPVEASFWRANISGPMNFRAADLTGPGPWAVSVYAPVAAASFSGTVWAADATLDFFGITGSASTTASRPMPVPVEVPRLPSLPSRPGEPLAPTVPGWCVPPPPLPAPQPLPPTAVVPTKPAPEPTIIIAKPMRRETMPVILEPTTQPIFGEVMSNRPVEASIIVTHPQTNNISVVVTPLDIVPATANLSLTPDGDRPGVEVRWDRNDRNEPTWVEPTRNRLQIQATATLPDMSTVVTTQILNVAVSPTTPPPATSGGGASDVVGGGWRDWHNSLLFHLF